MFVMHRAMVGASILAVAMIAAPTQAQENFFTGAVDSDYNTAGNWSLGIVPGDPGGGFATIGDFPANTPVTATITADTPVLVGDFRIGKVGGDGTLNHSSGTLRHEGWAFIGVDSNVANGQSVAEYNLTGDASYIQDGAVNERRFEIGTREEAGATPPTATVNIDTTGEFTTSNASVGTTGEGELNLVNGTHNALGFLNVGSGFDGLNGGTGVYNQSGGELNVPGGPAPFGALGWMSIANGSETTGTFNMTGGVLNQGIDFLTVGDNGDGTFILDGSTGAPDANVTDRGIIVGRNGGSTGLLDIVGAGGEIDTTGLIVGLNDVLDPGGDGTLSYTSVAGDVNAITASGDVNLGASASLLVDIETSPIAADEVILVAVGGAVNGIFSGLPEGTVVPGAGGRFISYAGGDGNDIVLTIPEPASILMLLTGGVACLVRRRV